MLEYLFKIQVRVRLPIAEARLLVATNHSIQNRGLLMFCKSQRGFYTAQLSPDSSGHSEVEHPQVQRITLQRLTLWHPNSLEQAESLALISNQVYTGRCRQTWAPLAQCKSVVVQQQFSHVVPEQIHPAFQPDVLIHAQQSTNITYPDAVSQLALIWLVQTTGRTDMSVCTCLERHPPVCTLDRELPKLSQTSQGKMQSLSSQESLGHSMLEDIISFC